jgi:MFS transporter, SET family, sugar efflux transporter
LILCATMGVVAFGMVWAIQTPLVYVSAFCLLVPFGNALFSQSFSYSRAYFDRERPERAELIMSLLRSMFTLAWIIVPPLAGWIAAQWSAYSVFALSALAHVGCTLAVGLIWIQPMARIKSPTKSGQNVPSDAPPRVRIAATHRFGVAGVILSLAALQLNIVLLPLVILRDLSGSLTQVGIAASLAAAIEMPVMIGWGHLALRIRKDLILAIASATFAVYFGLMAFVDSFTQVLLAQGIAAVAISALLSMNIGYLQEVIPGRIGLSTSLVDVTRVISVWAAAAIFSLNSGTTYASLMGVAALLSLCGAGMMLFARQVSRQGETG